MGFKEIKIVNGKKKEENENDNDNKNNNQNNNNNNKNKATQMQWIRDSNNELNILAVMGEK